MLRLSTVSPGNPGIFETVDKMRRLVVAPSPRSDTLSSQIKLLYPGEHARAAAVHTWVVRHMRYAPDYHEIDGLDAGVEEALIEPELLLASIENRGYALGDCDDYTMLSAALLYRMDIPLDFIVGSTRDDQVFNHVYLQAHTEHGVFAMDGIFGEPFGWSAAGAFTAVQVLPL